MNVNSTFKYLTISYTLSTFSEGIMMPIYAIYVQKIGGDILDASAAIGIFLLVSGLITYLIHRRKWSEKNRSTLLLLGWIIWLIGIGSYLYVYNIISLFYTQVLLALGNAIADPAFDAEFSINLDKNIVLFEWGIFDSMKDIVSGLAAIFGGLIAITWGFKALILTMIASASISLIIILLYLYKYRKEVTPFQPTI